MVRKLIQKTDIQVKRFTLENMLVLCSLCCTLLIGASTGCQFLPKSAQKQAVQESAFEESEKDQQLSQEDEMAEFLSAARKQGGKKREPRIPGQTFLMSDDAKNIYHNLDR